MLIAAQRCKGVEQVLWDDKRPTEHIQNPQNPFQRIETGPVQITRWFSYRMSERNLKYPGTITSQMGGMLDLLNSKAQKSYAQSAKHLQNQLGLEIHTDKLVQGKGSVHPKSWKNRAELKISQVNQLNVLPVENPRKSGRLRSSQFRPICLSSGPINRTSHAQPR